MNPQINQLVRSLLQKETIEQCSLQELEQFADRHPYFGAAQLLLTKKLQTESPERYDEQLQKTFLFFHNPLWVQHLLNDTGNGSITEPVKKEELQETFLRVADPVPAIDETELDKMEPVQARIESIQTPPEESTEAVIAESAPSQSEYQGQIISEQEPGIKEFTEEHVTEEPALQIPALKLDVAESPKDELLFEPYHTVDYFASQGIKFNEEEKPKDKFGQQLKSFTDWLKVMKRLPVTEITKAVEIKAEAKVEQLAEHSLEQRDIVTEAMAEVWEKQGNIDKAIGVYTKLSLLYPSKNLYFAAKIDALKKLN